MPRKPRIQRKKRVPITVDHYKIVRKVWKLNPDTEAELLAALLNLSQASIRRLRSAFDDGLPPRKFEEYRTNGYSIKPATETAKPTAEKLPKIKAAKTTTQKVAAKPAVAAKPKVAAKPAAKTTTQKAAAKPKPATTRSTKTKTVVRRRRTHTREECQRRKALLVQDKIDNPKMTYHQAAVKYNLGHSSVRESFKAAAAATTPQ